MKSEKQKAEGRWKRFKTGFAHAFAYDDGRAEITPDDIALLDKVASFVVRRRLAAPAILLLESTGPLNFVGSSLMTFFRPIVALAFKTTEYERLEQLLDKRCSLSLLVERIELRDRRESEARTEKQEAPPARTKQEAKSTKRKASSD